QVGPREVALAWASLGLLALEAGRRDEAEDRLKRAVALDPEDTFAPLLLARVRCDLGPPAHAVAPLRQGIALPQKNLDARLLLVRALVESKFDSSNSEAQKLLTQVAADAPKEARVPYWQARLLLAGEKTDREGALAKLKEALQADPKLLAAYLTQS